MKHTNLTHDVLSLFSDLSDKSSDESEVEMVALQPDHDEAESQPAENDLCRRSVRDNRSRA